MIEHSQIRLPFASISGKRVEADFAGGTVTSDGGVLLLRKLESQMGFVARMVEALRMLSIVMSCGTTRVSRLPVIDYHFPDLI